MHQVAGLPYPYAGRDLFAKPETYEYAAATPDLVGAWERHRRDAIVRMRANATEATEEPIVTARPGQFALATLLEGLQDGRTDPTGSGFPGGVLSALASKFEMFRRLFRLYDASGRKIDGSPTATVGEYVLFAAVLVRQPDLARRARLLSTLLKVTDALVSVDVATISRPRRTLLADVIEQEVRLVAGWQRHGAQA